MFFDIVILNPQHRGNFSHAWIAATRGVRFVTKGHIKELDIPILCRQLADFITTSSNDPKKRFSLRLSAILLNGTIKIYREKVLLLQAEVISALHTIRVPSGMSSMPVYPGEASGILETPPTPSVKVKRRRRGKKQVVATPIIAPAEPEPDFVARPLQIADVADILQVLPTTSDLISLREEAPRRVDTLIPDEDDFGIITGADLEKEITSLFPRAHTESVVQSVTPETPSSEFPPPQEVEVVALIHAEKGEFLEVPRLPSVREVPRVLSEMPILMDMDEIRTLTEAEVPVADPSRLLPEEAPVGAISEENVLREIPPPQSQVRSRVAKSKETKDKLSRPKLFLGTRSRPIVRINRCIEGGGTYVDEPCPLPIAVKSFRYEDWFNLYWPEEDEEVREDVGRPGSSGRSISFGLRRTSTSKKRSSLERDSTAAASVLETPLKEIPSISGIDILPTPEERTREKLHEQPEVPIPTRLEAGRVTESSVPQEPSIPPIQPLILEELLAESVAPVTQELPSEIAPLVHYEEPSRKKKEPSRAPESLADHRRRHQRIIDLLLKWNFEEEPPTIEDICEKPMTKLNMAKAFSDLLVLCKKKYIILCSEADSIQLKCIQLGQRLQIH